MTRTLEDPSLEVPALATLAGATDDLDIGPGGRIDDGGGFHLPGLRGVLIGSDRGVDQLWLYPFRVLHGLHVHGAEPAAARITAVGAERGLSVDGAGIVERLVVARDAPLAFLEWRANDRPVKLAVSWEVDLATDPSRPEPATRGLRWARAESGLGVGVPATEGAGGGPHAPTLRAVYALHPDADIAVRETQDGIRVRVTARLDPGSALRLGVGGWSAEQSGRTVRMLGRPAVAASGRRGHLSRTAADRLVLEDADAAVDRRLSAAIRGLDALRAGVPGIGRSFLAGFHSTGSAVPCATFRTRDAIAAAHAGLAVGDVGGAADTLELLARHQDPEGRVPSEVTLAGDVRPGPAADTVAFVVLAARFLAWTGDLPAARKAWPAVVRAVDPEGTGPAWLMEEPGGAAAVRALVPAAEELGDTSLAGRLREVLGSSGDPGSSEPPHRAVGREGPDSCPGGAADLAAAVREVVDGLLGADPDAPRGRLVLRPRPAGRASFRVRHLGMGDAAIGLAYRREGEEGGAVVLHHFTVEQERGAVPVTVVLEPVLPGARVRQASVDGRPAELDPRREADGWRVPVQVVLDHRRSVVVELEQPVP